METPSDAPAIVQDQPAETPVVDAPSTETSAPVESPEYFSENFDPNGLPAELQPAYKQMQGAFTKKTQDLAEQRKEAENAVAFINALRNEDQRQVALQQLADEIGPDAVLEALGYTTDEDTPDLPEDPGERALAEIEALKQQQAQAQQQAQEAQRIAQIDSYVQTQLTELGVTDQAEQEFLVGHALASLPPDEHGMPRVKEAFDKFTGIWEARQKAWLDSKAGAQKVSGGTAGVQEYDWKNPDQRVARLAAIMDAQDD